MPTISQLLQYILSKRYGEEVRGAIHDAIEKCYQDVNSATLREDAFQAALQAAIEHGDIPGMVIADNSVPGTKIKDGTLPLSKLAEPVQITVDSALSASSTNPVQNKVIKGAIDELNGSLEEQEEKMLDVETTVGKFESVAIDEQLWVNRGVNVTTGEVVEDTVSDIRITHRDLVGLDGESITFYSKAGYKFYVIRFFKSGTFDGALRTNGTFSKVGTSNVANVDSYTVSERDSKAYLYRFVLKKEDNSNISTSDSVYFLYAMNDTVSAIQKKLNKPNTNGENGQVVISDGYGGTRWEDMPSENLDFYDALRNLLMDAYYKNDNHAEDIQVVLRSTCTRKICYDNLIISDGVFVTSGLETLYIS